MLFIGFLFPLLVSCYSLPNNTLWIGNENLISTLLTIYEQLPVSALKDVGQAPKRSFAIIADLVLQYLEANSSNALEIVQLWVNKLPEPADVIAGNPIKYLDTFKSLIDQPINDIKISCKPDTSDMACIDRFYYYEQQQIDKCAKYENHQKLRKDAEDIARDSEFRQFLADAITTSQFGFDSLAASFFVHSTHTFDGLFKHLKNIYQSAILLEYPCV